MTGKVKTVVQIRRPSMKSGSQAVMTVSSDPKDFDAKYPTGEQPDEE